MIGHLVLPVLVVVQIVLFIVGEAFGATEQNPLPALLGLHGLNGVAMLVVSLWLGLGAFCFLRTGSRRGTQERRPDLSVRGGRPRPASPARPRVGRVLASPSWVAA